MRGRPLEVGVQLPEVEREVRWPEYAGLAVAAEAAGFDSVWVGDHLLYRPDAGRPERGPWDAWTLLAALATATRTVKLGPLVACTGFHPPGLLARMAATVDEVSGGRLVFGLGAGWNEDEFRAFGLPADRRVSRFAEEFEVVRRLLAGDRVTFDGLFCRTHDAVLLPPPAREVPLMIGSNGERMLGIALPHVSAWNTWYLDYGNTPEGFSELNAMVDRRAGEVGRDPREIRRSACVLVVLDPTAGERPASAGAPGLGPRPEHVAAELRALAEGGADEAILVVDPINERSIRELEEVLALLDA